MISKKLAIAAALVLMAGIGAAPAVAQTTAPQPAGTADQAPPPAAGTPDQAATPAAPGTPGAADQMAAAPAAPAPAPEAAPADASKPAGENPYGLWQLWSQGDFVAKGTIVLLAIMSIGTWYIFFMKYWEQSRMLSQAKIVEKQFWASANLNEGIDKLPKNSVFRSVAESGVARPPVRARASSTSTTGSACR